MYWIFKNVILDGQGLTQPYDYFAGITTNYASHYKLQDVEIRNMKGSGIHQCNGNGVQYIRVNVHDTEMKINDFQSHGMYISAANTLVDGGQYHDNGGYGLHFFDSGAGYLNDNTIRNVKIYNNGSDPYGDGGAIFGNGARYKVYNNLFYGNGSVSLQVNPSCVSCEIYQNTVTEGALGIYVLGLHDILKNNIAWNNSDDFDYQYAQDMPTLAGNVISVDPHFAAAGSHNYMLLADSVARGAGVDLSGTGITGVLTDILGVTRGSPSPDAGAYSYSANGVPSVKRFPFFF